MIDYQIYKMIHLAGLALLMMGLAGILFAFAMQSAVPPKLKALGFATHGIGMFLMLLGGFGMLARLGLVQGLPGWIYAKLAIWLILGGGIALAKRKSSWAPILVPGFMLLVVAAAYLAIYKPF